MGRKKLSRNLDRGKYYQAEETWGFPKIRGIILGVPIVRTEICWGLFLGPFFWETTPEP